MLNNLRVWDLGRKNYRTVLGLQERLVLRRREDRVTDTLLLVEHDPVYTLGRNADRANVLFSDKECRRRNIDIVETGRGGDVTYHGPGQLVGYPIIDLHARGKGVLWYVEHLESVMVDLLRAFGLEPETDRHHRGVWVKNEKIAAIGVRITRGITMHGIALNVSTDLEYFMGIIPCGIRDKGVTSMERLRIHADMAEVKKRLRDSFIRLFGYDKSKIRVSLVGAIKKGLDREE